MSGPSRTFGVDLELVPADTAALPLTDLTIRRGYGAFDFLRVERGVPLFVDDHLARLERSADLLGLAPRPAPDAIRAHVFDVIDANRSGSFGMQLFVTGGDPVDGFEPGTPRTLVLVVDLPAYPASYYQDGVSLLMHRFERDLPEAKTTNYFNAVRHARSLRAGGAADLLYHDGRRVLETTRCNLFVASSTGGWVTPSNGVLPGVTRKHMLAALAEDEPAEVRDVTLDELGSAREAFITSTTKGVMPVVRIDDSQVGEGVPGEATRRAEAAFLRRRDAYLASFAGVTAS